MSRGLDLDEYNALPRQPRFGAGLRAYVVFSIIELRDLAAGCGARDGHLIRLSHVTDVREWQYDPCLISFARWRKGAMRRGMEVPDIPSLPVYKRVAKAWWLYFDDIPPSMIVDFAVVDA